MRKLSGFLVFLLIIAFVFGIIGCDDDPSGSNPVDEFAQYYAPTFRANNNGTVDVINPTQHNMLLFRRGALINSSILGGVRAGGTAQINFSDNNDFIVGGYEIIYAIKQSEYETARGNSNIDYSAMVTYRNNSRFRITLQSRYDGNFEYILFNRSTDWPMELRKNSIDGEKIAFLARGEGYHRVYSGTSEPFIGYPAWIAYNNLTRAITTFVPTGSLAFGPQTIQPKTTPDDFYFPSGGITTINFDVEIPFATIVVTNNAPLSSQSGYFRNAGNRYTPQSSYPLITSGSVESFEIRSTGASMNLNIALGIMQDIIVPVREESNPSIQPTIENGWYYTVELNFKASGDPDDVNDYTAWLVKAQQINPTQFVTAE
ncbi:MAG: hypothetical protein FWD40_01850 [Treponema sp.]|nr:hypothetical protein [Treponema sp.]